MSKARIEVSLTADTSKFERALVEAEARIRYPALYRYSPNAAVAAIEFERTYNRVDAILREKTNQ